MEQMKAFIEKAKNDSALMDKLNKLGASGAAPDKIVALAAEHGFAITAEDYRQAVKAAGAAGARKSGELKEEDLEAAAGGIFGQTENRYDPKVCGNYSKVHHDCVGILELNWCDHYRRETREGSLAVERHMCQMGYFDHKA